MLVLSRKAGESIRIGDDLRIVILRMDRQRVQIGVEAPRDVTIFRGELVSALSTVDLVVAPMSGAVSRRHRRLDDSGRNAS